MSARDLESWMWAEAVRMLDRAERVEQQFFRPGSRPRRPQWEPPVDVYETADAFTVVVALPGVAADGIEAEIVDGVLVIAGEHRIPRAMRSGVLHRLEIPHGRFERRLTLPRRALVLEDHECIDGCLYLTLRKEAP